MRGGDAVVSGDDEGSVAHRPVEVREPPTRATQASPPIDHATPAPTDVGGCVLENIYGFLACNLIKIVAFYDVVQIVALSIEDCYFW